MALVRARFNACPDRKRNAAERLNTLIRVSSCPIDPCYVLTRDGFVAREMRNMSNAPYSGFDPALTVVLAEAFDRADRDHGRPGTDQRYRACDGCIVPRDRERVSGGTRKARRAEVTK
jgi:hypothetical protein